MLLGDFRIDRAVEWHGNWVRPEAFFPDFDRKVVDENIDWLASAFDAATGEMVLSFHSFVLRTGRYTILVDTCMGNDKEREGRARGHRRKGDFLGELARQGVRPEEVDFVMCTHLHADHVGWNTRWRDGRWVPTFPNARYVISEKELAHFQAQDNPPTPLVESVLPVVAAGQAQLVGGDFALDDAVSLQPTPGHTPGHFAVVLQSGARRAVLTGDMMHTPVQCHHPEWAARPDWDPAMASATRRAFLEAHCETDTLVCTAHFPAPSVGRIVRVGDRFGFRYGGAEAAGGR